MRNKKAEITAALLLVVVTLVFIFLASQSSNLLTGFAVAGAPAGAIAGAGITAGTAQPAAGLNSSQTFEFVVTAVNNNIIRISGGKLPGCYQQ